MTSYACVVFWDVIWKVPVLLLCKGLHIHLYVIVPMVPDVVREGFGVGVNKIAVV